MNKSIYILLNQKLKTMDEWRISNTVFMLGIVLGTKLDAVFFGPEVIDASEIIHAGIGNTVLPVLSVKESEMVSIYKTCKNREMQGSFEVIDFTLTAQNSNEYDQYAQKLSSEKIEDQTILGIALFGDTQIVKSITGRLARWK